MGSKQAVFPVERIERSILLIRGQKVILDADLARLYGVTTKRLNEQVRRNQKRFPNDFMFRLTKQEVTALRSQFATSNVGRGGRRYFPYVFTEHGAIMAASVLNTQRAVDVSVYVVRAFVKMRRVFTDTHELARKLTTLERELKTRMDVHETAIVDILRRIMDLIDPPKAPEPPRRRIGF